MGRKLASIIKKELYLYFIGSGFAFVTIILSTGLFLLFRFTYPVEAVSKEVVISSLWSVHLISSLFALMAAQEWEWENNAMRAVKLSGVEGYVVFLGKSLAGFLSLVSLWSAEWVVWSLMFGLGAVQGAYPEARSVFSPESVSILGRIFLAGLPACAGIAFLGQITSALALHSRFRHVLQFIVFFPLSLPLIIAGGEYSRIVWRSAGDGAAGQGVLFLVFAFMLFFFAAGNLLYDYLWEE